jgi:hypothetical protein
LRLIATPGYFSSGSAITCEVGHFVYADQALLLVCKLMVLCYLYMFYYKAIEERSRNEAKNVVRNIHELKNYY